MSEMRTRAQAIAKENNQEQRRSEGNGLENRNGDSANFKTLVERVARPLQAPIISQGGATLPSNDQNHEFSQDHLLSCSPQWRTADGPTAWAVSRKPAQGITLFGTRKAPPLTLPMPRPSADSDTDNKEPVFARGGFCS